MTLLDGGEQARDYMKKEPEQDTRGSCAVRQGCVVAVSQLLAGGQ